MMSKSSYQLLASVKTRRKLWLKVHLYLGLIVGVLFVLQGLTGSINVFYRELDEIIYPELKISNPGQQFRSWEELLSIVKEAYPGREGAWILRLPRYPTAMLNAWNTDPESKQRLMVYVNPYTGEIVSSRNFGETFGTWFYILHSNLLLGRTGHFIILASGILFIISLGSGLYLWWPKGKKIKQAFSIKLNAGFARLIFDIHRAFGIYSFMVLFVLAFSGVSLAFDLKPVVSVFSSVRNGAPHGHGIDVKSTKINGKQTISISEAVEIANQVFPDAVLRRITTPDNEDGVYIIRKYQAEEANYAWPSTVIWIDQYSGKVLAYLNPYEYTAGEIFLNVLFPLHSGEALGLLGRAVVFVSGFVPLILFISGIFHWLHIRNYRRRRAR
jgi:uncharacterized iron-regulated membrane protein